MVKKSACQCRRCRFDPWVRKITWRGKWQPIPVFLSQKSHGQRSLAGYSLWDCKELDISEQLSTHKDIHTHAHTYIYILHIIHNLPSYHFKWSVQLVSTFTLCNESPKLFSSLKAETLYLLNNSPLPPLPKPWQLPFYFLSL